MPSPLLVNLAQSQMELLAFSVARINSMSLYLPQENEETGQLEFLSASFLPTIELWRGTSSALDTHKAVWVSARHIFNSWLSHGVE